MGIVSKDRIIDAYFNERYSDRSRNMSYEILCGNVSVKTGIDKETVKKIIFEHNKEVNHVN